MIEFDKSHPQVRTGEKVPGWPSDVQRISPKSLDLVGVGDDGRLYWDGKEVPHHFHLTTSQGISATVLVGSAFVLALVGVLSFFGLGAS